MKWATTKFLLIILFAAFLQNGIEAANPQMNELYRQMFLELSRQSALVYYSGAIRGDPLFPVLSKLEMGRHICAKIDLLGGILAELQAKRDKMEGEREYFLDENEVEIFFDFLRKREGEGHKTKFFSDFSREKLENPSYYAFIMNDGWWFMDELLGRKYPAEFFDILDRIMAMKLAPEGIGLESGMTAAYRPFQNALFKFIGELKLEIVIGQTHNEFEDLLKGRIQMSITEMQKKIDDGPKGILSKGLHPQKAKQKALFKKYKQMNEASLQLYYVLAPQIPIIIRKKAKKEEAKLSEETVQLASEVKKTFGEILPETLASTSSSVGKHSKGSSAAVLEIQRQLCLPNQWLEEQKKMYSGSSVEAMLLSWIHMNTAMLLLAYERTATFYD